MDTPPTKLVFLVFILLASIACFRLIYHIFIEHKKWIWAVVLFPVTVIAFCFMYWRDSRAYVFFFLLTLFASTLVASLLGQPFDSELLINVLRVGLWPITAISYLVSILTS